MTTYGPCPYCKSPSIMNPCWYEYDYPESGGDPPCMSIVYAKDRQKRRRESRLSRWNVVIGVAAIILTAGLILWRYHAP